MKSYLVFGIKSPRLGKIQRRVDFGLYDSLDVNWVCGIMIDLNNPKMPIRTLKVRIKKHFSPTRVISKILYLNLGLV
ncbi:hypothetical protein DQM68_05635 [Leptospira mayottensis]|uniref:Uncharacterized protein n=2 Tax=Leptospira mayottensis TaxID=1137606 RepID=A0AA87MTG3_9LEPT|nr:hypothetical protein DQM68_05635 [Leptospira mayottensis]AXR64053.1 hypothetical protein DQM28_07255 [Leptospira mayottensis]AZQ03313.1 hypothetical protein LEP1GSC190_16115 [Leptospira mayottensis 200901116]EKS01531.1 hypothetical protein LEP1GSC125_4277 [Leptospira mayottensis 200901122]TGM99674.1 hypothetical protein EHR03_14045 [Leptospira mayottensis]